MRISTNFPSDQIVKAKRNFNAQKQLDDPRENEGLGSRRRRDIVGLKGGPEGLPGIFSR